MKSIIITDLRILQKETQLIIILIIVSDDKSHFLSSK